MIRLTDRFTASWDSICCWTLAETLTTKRHKDKIKPGESDEGERTINRYGPTLAWCCKRAIGLSATDAGTLPEALEAMRACVAEILEAVKPLESAARESEVSARAARKPRAPR